LQTLHFEVFKFECGAIAKIENYENVQTISNTDTYHIPYIPYDASE